MRFATLENFQKTQDAHTFETTHADKARDHIIPEVDKWNYTYICLRIFSVYTENMTGKRRVKFIRLIFFIYLAIAWGQIQLIRLSNTNCLLSLQIYLKQQLQINPSESNFVWCCCDGKLQSLRWPKRCFYIFILNLHMWGASL